MESTRAPIKLTVPVLLATGLWLPAIVAYWVLYGWKMPFAAPLGAAFPEFPGRALAALAEAALTSLLLLLAGAGVLRACGARQSPGAAAWGLCFLVGGAAGGAVAALLAFAKLIPLAAILLPVILATRAWQPLWEWRPKLRGSTIEAWLAMAALLLVVLAAMAPAAESDGLRYHLVGPQEWRRAGRFVLVPFSANTNIPAHLGLLAACSSWVGDTGRVLQLLNAAHLAALMAVCGAIGEGAVRSFGFGVVGARGFVALLVIGIPVVAVIGAWPFSDVASAAYLFAAVWLLGPRALRGNAARIALASLLLGAAVATKISNLPLACIAGLWLLAAALRSRRPELLVLVVAPGLLALGPWMVKNLRYHGNPVYPVAYGVFGGPEWSAKNDEFYKAKLHEKGVGHDVIALLKSPWDVTAHWEKFEEHNPGPAPLALLPGALVLAFTALRRRRFASREALLVALLVGGWLVWFRSYQSVRFLIPQLIILVVLGGAWILARVRPYGRCTLTALGMIGVVWVANYRLVHVPIYQAAVGAWSEDFFIAKRFSTYPTLRWLESATEPGEPVFYIGEHRAAYAHRFRPVASDWYDTPRVLTEIRATPDNAALYDRWRGQGIRYVLANFAELGLYEELYFKPRFTSAEWDRFEALRKDLLTRVAFEGAPGLLVLEVPPPPTAPPPTRP